MTLPTYMLAISPQTKSGWFWNRSGPGWMPYMMKAPMRIAVDPDAGMPSARRCTKAPQLSALTAASGAATPSIALAELLRRLGDVFLGGVGKHRRDCAAKTGRRPAKEAHCPAAQHGWEGLFPIGLREPDSAFQPHAVHRAFEGALGHAGNLGQSEYADHDREKVHALLQVHQSKGEARSPALQVEPDGGDREPKRGRKDSFGERLSGQRAHRAQRENHQREVFGRTKVQRECGNRCGHEGKRGDAERAGDEGAHRRD